VLALLELTALGLLRKEKNRERRNSLTAQRSLKEVEKNEKDQNDLNHYKLIYIKRAKNCQENLIFSFPNVSTFSITTP